MSSAIDPSGASDESDDERLYRISAFFAGYLTTYSPEAYGGQKPGNEDWKQAMPFLPEDLKKDDPEYIQRQEVIIYESDFPDNAKCRHIMKKGVCEKPCYILQLHPSHSALKAADEVFYLNPINKNFKPGTVHHSPRNYYTGNQKDRIFVDDTKMSWLIHLDDRASSVKENEANAAKAAATKAGNGKKGKEGKKAKRR